MEIFWTETKLFIVISTYQFISLESYLEIDHRVRKLLSVELFGNIQTSNSRNTLALRKIMVLLAFVYAIWKL